VHCPPLALVTHDSLAVLGDGSSADGLEELIPHHGVLKVDLREGERRGEEEGQLRDRAKRWLSGGGGERAVLPIPSLASRL
jgi:hypothetical protein